MVQSGRDAYRASGVSSDRLYNSDAAAANDDSRSGFLIDGYSFGVHLREKGEVEQCWK